MKRFWIECTADFAQQVTEVLKTCGSDAEICFAPGTYVVTEPFRLERWNHDLTFKADGEVRFVGSLALKNWKSIEGLPEAERFIPEVRDKIQVCDLEEAGIAAARPLESRGYAHYITTGHSELFADGEPLMLAQYPKATPFSSKEGFTTISGVVNPQVDCWGTEMGELEDGFYCTDPRLKNWKLDQNVRVFGYWMYDWANSCEQLEQYDPADGKIVMKAPYGVYGYHSGQRIRFYNVMEEVLEPGDYCIDFETNRVYLYPKEGVTELRLGMLNQPFFFLDHCENITFEGLTFEMTCASGIEAEFTEKLHIDGCCFYNMGNYAVTVMEGHDPLIENCTIHDCGDGGVLIFGGNRCTLEPIRGTVNNNHIYNIAKWTKCYQPAIYLIGVGLSAKHNLLHDCPHTAIMYWGNEITIEDNEIYRAVLETGDAGAIYTGNDFTFRGNSVSHNYIHHLGGVGFGSMGIYNDDSVSGTKMYNNYLEELTRGIMLGGGRSFQVKNNVFVKCDPAISFDCRSADPHPARVNGTKTLAKSRFYRIERYPHADRTTRRNQEMIDLHHGEWVSAMDSEYIRRYPELKDIDDLFRYQRGNEVYIPGQATIQNNVFISKLKFRYTYDEHTKKIYDRGEEVPATRMMRAYVNDFSRDILRTISGRIGELNLISNYQAKPEDFEDPDWSDLRVKRGSEAERYGYVDADFASIGLQESRRRRNPARVNMTVQFVPGDPTVRVGLRNRKDEPVEGNLLFKVSEDVKLETNQIAFELAGGEEKFYEVPVLAAGEDAVIDVHSNVPGVRPARS
ncbi:MAG: right-handed parallel beta-helix repeat-containing protein [Lachnospiraceae bacterium]|nr:right-handed parallel beta-helix repeat-containing protein [Lachnospiraceae bacterium]